MRITKYTHACVRLEREDGGVLVIDPGEWSEPTALAGADAVLVTHEHGDHIDVLRLIGLGVEVYVPEGVSFEGLEATQIAAGSSAEIAGFSVSVVSGRHAFVDGEQPSCVNFGYIIDDSVYHPGDALTVPDRPIETLLVPMYASWLKTAEALDFMRAVSPKRAFGIHDAQLNERGLASINSWFSYASATDYHWRLSLAGAGRLLLTGRSHGGCAHTRGTLGLSAFAITPRGIDAKISRCINRFCSRRFRGAGRPTSFGRPTGPDVDGLSALAAAVAGRPKDEVREDPCAA